ncbi:MAG TPA: electron transfer flavoprotein subunit alpha/FixB family protein, partial [Micavibrio sp.]
MPILIVAEHNNAELNAGTFNAASAAAKLGGDIHILVAGLNCRAVAESAAKITGVSKVLHSDDAAYAHELAENIAALIA